MVGTWKHLRLNYAHARAAVFKLNSDETAQILARDPRRPRRSREERRATAKEKRNGRIKSIVRKRRGKKKSIEFVYTYCAIVISIVLYSYFILSAAFKKCCFIQMWRVSILPVAVQNLRELNNFPKTNCGCVSGSRFKRTEGRGDSASSPPNGKPFLIVSAAAEETLISRSKSQTSFHNTPTCRRRDISQTKLRTSVAIETARGGETRSRFCNL